MAEERENNGKKVQSFTPQHNDFVINSKDYSTGLDYEAKITSNFDSGNLHDINVNPDKHNHIIFYPAPDSDKFGNSAANCSWFYFRVTGMPLNIKLTFEARKINIQHRLFKNNIDVYRPVIKIGENGNWHKIKERAVLDTTDNKELFAMFPITFDFDNNENFLEIAFCFPYKHEEMMKDISVMSLAYENHDQIFFHHENLIKTVEGLDVPLITITNHDSKLEVNETYNILDGVSQCPKFENKKPVIQLSCRVHPGETPASHAQNGVIKFQLKPDKDANMLRHNFVFKIVPSLNPDGVWNGHFRKDRYQQNLNRFYKRPDVVKQPTCFVLKKLMEYFTENHRLIFFSDFHAHSSTRNNFVYGNHCNFVRQVEARLFTKIFDKLESSFTYEDCDFSAYQMKSKEKGDDAGKEGSARVQGYHQCSLAHSYTLEMSYHSSMEKENEIKVEIDPLELIDMERVGENFQHSLLYQFGIKKKIDDIEVNLKALREEIASSIKKLFMQDELRLESKCKEVNELVEDQYYMKVFREQVKFIRDNIKNEKIVKKEVQKDGNKDKEAANIINKDGQKDSSNQKNNGCAKNDNSEHHPSNNMMCNNKQGTDKKNKKMRRFDSRELVSSSNKNSNNYQLQNQQFLSQLVAEKKILTDKLLFFESSLKNLYANYSKFTATRAEKNSRFIYHNYDNSYYNSSINISNQERDLIERAEYYRIKIKDIDALEKAQRDLYESEYLKELGQGNVNGKSKDQNALKDSLLYNGSSNQCNGNNSASVSNNNNKNSTEKVIDSNICIGSCIVRTNRFIESSHRDFVKKNSVVAQHNPSSHHQNHPKGATQNHPMTSGDNSKEFMSYTRHSSGNHNGLACAQPKLNELIVVNNNPMICTGSKVNEIKQNLNSIFKQIRTKKVPIMNEYNNISIDENHPNSEFPDIFMLGKQQDGDSARNDLKTHERNSFYLKEKLEARNEQILENCKNFNRLDNDRLKDLIALKKK